MQVRWSPAESKTPFYMLFKRKAMKTMKPDKIKIHYEFCLKNIKKITQKLKNMETIKELLEQNDFSEPQKQQIILGLENGLTIDQIKIYAKPVFDLEQMEQIRLGFENGLTIDEVLAYAHPKLKSDEMYNKRMKCIIKE